MNNITQNLSEAITDFLTFFNTRNKEQKLELVEAFETADFSKFNNETEVKRIFTAIADYLKTEVSK